MAFNVVDTGATGIVVAAMLAALAAVRRLPIPIIRRNGNNKHARLETCVGDFRRIGEDIATLKANAFTAEDRKTVIETSLLVRRIDKKLTGGREAD